MIADPIARVRALLPAWPVFALSLLLLLPSPALSADPPEIHSGLEPLEGTRTLQLEEIWRAGGEEDDENFFGVINQVESDAEGNLYLLDAQLVHVHVYDAEGNFVGTLSREGEGPGEVGRPNDMLLLPGGKLGILDAIGSKLVLVDLDGSPAGSIVFGDAAEGGNLLRAGEVAYHDGHYVVMGGEGRREGQGMVMIDYLSIFGADGKEIVRLLEHEGQTFDGSRPSFVERQHDFVGRGRWALGPDGRVYANPERDRYAIQVYSPQGELERVISRDFTSRKRTEEDLEGLQNQVAIIVNGRRVPIDHELEDYDACLRRIWVDATGELWVSHAWSIYEQPEGIFTTFDVFGTDGRYREKVQIAVDGDPQRDRLFRLDDEHYVLVRRFMDARRAQFALAEDVDEEAEVEPLEVVYYRVSD